MAESSDFAAGEAVLRFHDALETFLLAVADHVGVPRAWRSFHELPFVIEKQAKKPFVGTAVVNELGDLRTATKHHGRFPRFVDVFDLATRIDSVFEENAKRYVRQSFAGVSLASSIEHPETSAAAAKSEVALEEGRFFDSMMESQTAFRHFMSHFKEAGVPDDAARWLRLPDQLMSAATGESTPRGVADGVNRAWKEATERLELAMLGINIADYATFRYLGPTVLLSAYGNRIQVNRSALSSLLYTAEHAAFCLTFLLNTVDRLQQTTTVRDVRSQYTVRARRETALYALLDDSSFHVERQLAMGEQLADASLGLGHAPMQECWIVRQDGKVLMVKAADCEIVSEQRTAARMREVRQQAQPRQGDQEAPPNEDASAGA